MVPSSSRLRSHEDACELRRGSPKPLRRRRHAVRIHVAIITRQSLATRVAALEEKVGNKTIEEQFRDQAELIDRRLDESFRAQAELIDRRLDDSFRSQAELIDRLFLERNKQWDVRFSGMEKGVTALKVDVSTLKVDVSTLKTDVSALKKDMTIVREGVGILLKRGR